ncbi:MAG: hypothetical protein MRZ57_04610 [Bacteroidales bacterium]|nr:hypothetical protein [Bacteroidales bacterium]
MTTTDRQKKNIVLAHRTDHSGLRLQRRGWHWARQRDVPGGGSQAGDG